MRTIIEYSDARRHAYEDCAPSIDLQERDVFLCDDENAVLEQLPLKDISRIIWEQSEKGS